LRRLFDREPAEEPQFDDPALALVERRQSGERIVERHDVERALVEAAGTVGQRYRRINRADMARKWVRSCQRTNRRQWCLTSAGGWSR
jgi:hypothetical protein